MELTGLKNKDSFWDDEDVLYFYLHGGNTGSYISRNYTEFLHTVHFTVCKI